MQPRPELDRQQRDRQVEQARGELGDPEANMGKGQGLAVVFEQREQQHRDAHDAELAEHQQRAGGQRRGVGGRPDQEIGPAQNAGVERVGGDERGGGGEEQQPDQAAVVLVDAVVGAAACGGLAAESVRVGGGSISGALVMGGRPLSDGGDGSALDQ